MMLKLLPLILLCVSPIAHAAVAVSIESLLAFVLYVVILGLIFWLLLWLISYVGLPEPFAKVAKIVLAVVAVLILVNVLLGVAGSPIITLGR